MTSAIPNTLRAQAFDALSNEARRLQKTPLAALFGADPNRAAQWTLNAPHLTVDLSKQRLSPGVAGALARLAEAAEFNDWRTRLLYGEIVNVTEKRAAQHIALRAAAPPPEMAATRARTADFARGLSGVNAVVHIGIGGSDLGPRLIYDALRPLRRPDVTVRFAANIDGADIADALDGLDPKRTLVIIVSKTFTTLETLANGAAARAWLGDDSRLVAVTAAPDKAKAWGIGEARIFPFWDSIGGRYSVWSAVGLVLEIALAEGAFARVRDGAGEMDSYFARTPFAENAICLAAGAQMLNREVFGRGSYALIPYLQRLKLLPAWMQQLEMESNGKRVDRDGAALARLSAGVTWGEPGTVAQHSFFQLLHQGVEEIPVEFVLSQSGGEGPAAHRIPLLANSLAQARALMLGKSETQAKAEMVAGGMSEAEAARLAPHRTFPGDRASTIIGLDALTPESLGALLAFYEHRTFTQAVLAGINPFDQYGVELGKEMANQLTPAFEGKDVAGLDSSTEAWVKRLR